jgi:hypothetical protein
MDFKNLSLHSHVDWVMAPRLSRGDFDGRSLPEICNLWLARAFNAQDVEAAAAA